jgi:hypothetical protein
MSINGLDFDPVGGINTAVDVFARAGPVSAMPGMAGRMAPRKIIGMGMSKPP